jgi:hypothetical protein
MSFGYCRQKIFLFTSLLLIGTFQAVSVSAQTSLGSLKPDRVFTAQPRKSHYYIDDGIILGGHSSVTRAIITDIRRAPHQDYERIVFDIVGTQGGERVELERAPFYHIAVSPAMKRIEVTFIGDIQLSFDAEEIKASFQNSRMVENVDFFPLLENDRWMLTFSLTGGRAVEVVELGSPVRVILDLRAN